MPPLTSQDLQVFLDEHHLPGPIIHCAEPTPTVADAARVLGVEPNQIVKSLLFLVAGMPVLVIACGTTSIDLRPVAARFGVGKKQVKLADAAAVLGCTGYPAGTVPPFGHLQPLITLITPQVLAQPFVYAGGGEENALLRVDPGDLAAITQAEMLPGLKAGA
jgi:prolyl-tRNA editing enzyme YbaK/EbsC (Cys-tRNA(Pro) deacylase)